MSRQASPAPALPATGGGGGLGFQLLLSALIVASTFLFTSYNYINNDVAFLAWAAREIMGPPVFGVDILEVSPPLCVLVYVPAVALAKFVGLDWGIRLWMMLLSLLSLAAFWQSAEPALRKPVAAAFVVFLLFGYPNHYAQKDQIAFVLCVPYVAGMAAGRGWRITGGAMAGVGFLMKPYFLLPLVLLLALRRRFETGEKAIVAVALIYAAALMLFFRPYIFEMVPKAAATYFAFWFALRDFVEQSAIVLLCTLPVALAGERHPAARPYLLAALGFVAAAVLQRKGFYYHFMPAFGFTAMFLAASLRNPKRLVAGAAALFLVAEATVLAKMAYRWAVHRPELAATDAALLAALATSRSYVALSAGPYPGFPTAIHTASRFVGLAICEIFIEAARQDPALAAPLAIDQARRELGRKPDLVIVVSQDGDRHPLDIIGFLQQDAGFRALWQDYRFERRISAFDIYRRR